MYCIEQVAHWEASACDRCVVSETRLGGVVAVLGRDTLFLHFTQGGATAEIACEVPAPSPAMLALSDAAVAVMTASSLRVCALSNLLHTATFAVGDASSAERGVRALPDGGLVAIAWNNEGAQVQRLDATLKDLFAGSTACDRAMHSNTFVIGDVIMTTPRVGPEMQWVPISEAAKAVKWPRIPALGRLVRARASVCVVVVLLYHFSMWLRLYLCLAESSFQSMQVHGNYLLMQDQSHTLHCWGYPNAPK